MTRKRMAFGDKLQISNAAVENIGRSKNDKGETEIVAPLTQVALERRPAAVACSVMGIQFTKTFWCRYRMWRMP
jgi:hypothetical protein